jgi:hypothetical protein
MYHSFQAAIARMNEMYELPKVADHEIGKRLVQFYKIIGEEVTEIEDIIAMHGEVSDNLTSADVLRIKTGLADLLADVVVYCASEAQRWDIPLPNVLRVVMASNESKLGEDGKPIKDPETGKFLKGPNYWKPEPKIAQLLRDSWDSAELPDPAELRDITNRMNIIVPQAVKQEPLVQSENPQAEHRP